MSLESWRESRIIFTAKFFFILGEEYIAGAYSESVVESRTRCPVPTSLVQTARRRWNFLPKFGADQDKNVKVRCEATFSVLTFCVVILSIYQNSIMQCKDQFCMSSINPFLGHRTTVLWNLYLFGVKASHLFMATFSPILITDMSCGTTLCRSSPRAKGR